MYKRQAAAIALTLFPLSGAEAQSDTEVWSGTLTPDDNWLPPYRFAGWTELTPQYLTGSSLGKKTFTHGGTTYELGAIITVDEDGAPLALVVAFRGEFETAVLDALSLTVGTSSYNMSSAITADLSAASELLGGSVTVYAFLGPPTLTDGATVSVGFEATGGSSLLSTSMVVDEQTTPEVERYGFTTLGQYAAGELSPANFAFDGVTYDIVEVLNLIDEDQLVFVTSSGPFAGGLDSLVLVIDDETALRLGGRGAYGAQRSLFRWPYVPDWDIDAPTPVELSLVHRPLPPGDEDEAPFFPVTATIDDLDLTVGDSVRVELPEAEGGDPPVTYRLRPTLPPGLAFDAETRVISGVAAERRAGRIFTYTATDEDGDSADLEFTVAVAAAEEPPDEEPPPDGPPTFGDAMVADQVFTVGMAVRLALPAASGGGGELRYELTPGPSPGLSFDAKNRVLWGTPITAVGKRTYAYSATGGDASAPESASLTFAVTVQPAPALEDEPELMAAPAGETSVALIPGGDWAALDRSEFVVEVRGQKHGWTAWPASAAEAAGPGGFLVEGLDAESPYTFRLRAETSAGEAVYSEERSATTGALGSPCRPGPGFLCLRNDRFEVQAHWTNPDRENDYGIGTGRPAGASGESGLYWFFNEANIELVVKVLDGRALNGHFWVFYGALSDVEYWVTVNDTVAGGTRTYHNRPKEVCGQNDTRAFGEQSSGASGALIATEGPRSRPRSGRSWRSVPGIFGVDLLEMNAAPVEEAAASVPSAQQAGACDSSAERLCLLDDRFAVEVRLVDPNVADPESRERAAQVLSSLTTRETGFFWFFNEENIELAVKMLDGRAINGRFWFLYGGLSDVEYAITVTDAWTGLSQTYRNEAGSICGGVDTGVFE